MCPECFAGIALLLTGAISTGGVAAAALKVLRIRRPAAASEARKPESREQKEKLP
jgi:hypothetical protein